MSLKIEEFGKVDEENQKIIDTFYKPAGVFGFTNCDGYTLTNLFPKYKREISEFDIRDDDIWVVSYPKSGTTWTQETVWCLMNDLNFHLSKQINLSERFPFLDAPFIFDGDLLSKKSSQALQHLEIDLNLQKINTQPSRRFIKSHLPLDFLPRKLQNNRTNAKIICITRNPRDVCISQFHHSIVYDGFKGTFEEFADLFIKGLSLYGPYWDHIYSYWNRRSQLNALFIRYEDMKTKLPQTIELISKFLGKTLNEEEINQLVDHVAFDNMKDIETVNKQKQFDMFRRVNDVTQEAKFMRSGQIHQWKTKFNAEMVQKFQKWEEENLKRSDYTLDYSGAVN